MPDPPPRRRGRPRRVDEPTAIHVKMSERAYDAAYAQARAEAVSLAELCRRALQQRVDAPPR